MSNTEDLASTNTNIMKAVNLYASIKGCSLDESFAFIEECLQKAVRKRVVVHIDKDTGESFIFIGDDKIEGAKVLSLWELTI